MLHDLNWRTLDQRLLVLLYKVTYDLVAIQSVPASDYLIGNTRPSSRIHPLAYRQVTTLKDYYKFTFSPRTIIRKGEKIIDSFCFCYTKVWITCTAADDRIPKIGCCKNQHSTPSMAFQIHSTSTNAYEYSFCPRSIRDWNDLPDSLISSAEMSNECVSKFFSLVRARD